VFDLLGVIAGRHGNRSPNNAPRNAYLTRDGRWVAVSASATSVAERVMRLVGRPDIAEKPWFSSAGERSRRSEMLDGAVTKWIAARDLEEVVKAFEEAGAALAPSTTWNSSWETHKCCTATPSPPSKTKTSARSRCKT